MCLVVFTVHLSFEVFFKAVVGLGFSYMCDNVRYLSFIVLQIIWVLKLSKMAVAIKSRK